MVEAGIQPFTVQLSFVQGFTLFPCSINIWSHIPPFLLFPLLLLKLEMVNIKVHLLLFIYESWDLPGALPLEK